MQQISPLVCICILLTLTDSVITLQYLFLKVIIYFALLVIICITESNLILPYLISY